MAPLIKKKRREDGIREVFLKNIFCKRLRKLATNAVSSSEPRQINDVEVQKEKVSLVAATRLEFKDTLHRRVKRWCVVKTMKEESILKNDFYKRLCE